MAVKSRIEKSLIEKREFTRLSVEVKQKLVKAAEWRNCNLDVDILEGFDEDIFGKFVRDRENETGPSDDIDREMKVSTLCINRCV